MKILIIGAQGNLGEYMVKYFSKNNRVIGLGKKDIDISDRESIINTFKVINPDIIIHTAAITNIDFCESDESTAYKINTLGTMNFAHGAAFLNIPIVYISSSYVFNGKKKTPYSEIDFCDPINTFGKTKLAAEKLIRTLCKKYFIIRSSWIFGGNDCYVKKIIKEDSKIILSSKEIINPTYILDLCSSLEKIISTEEYGIYNCVNENYSTKIEVVTYVVEALNLKKSPLPIPEHYESLITPRPLFSALSTKLIYQRFKL